MAFDLPDAPCSFCAYLDGRQPYTIIRRDELTATLVTWEQLGNGHMLIVPIAHRETIFDLTSEERHAVIDRSEEAARAIVKAYDPGGVRIWQNNGPGAHQSVPHVHAHVVGLDHGRFAEGPVSRLSVDETDRIANELRPHLEAG